MFLGEIRILTLMTEWQKKLFRVPLSWVWMGVVASRHKLALVPCVPWDLSATCLACGHSLSNQFSHWLVQLTLWHHSCMKLQPLHSGQKSDPKCSMRRSKGSWKVSTGAWGCQAEAGRGTQQDQGAEHIVFGCFWIWGERICLPRHRNMPCSPWTSHITSIARSTRTWQTGSRCCPPHTQDRDWPLGH